MKDCLKFYTILRDGFGTHPPDLSLEQTLCLVRVYRKPYCYNKFMDREKLMGELIDSSVLQKQFFAVLHEHAIHHKPCTEDILDSQSPAYIEYSSAIQKIFGDNPNSEQIILFQLELIQMFLQMMAENNRAILSVMITYGIE